MTSALAWINDLVQWLGRWIPRVVIIPPTHRAVMFGPRGGARERGPGLIVYWPILVQCLKIPVTTQSLQLAAQILPLDNRDTERVLPRVRILKVAVQYRATDAVAVATRSLSPHAIVDNRAKAVIAAANGVPSRDALQVELSPYGLLVERFDVVSDGIGIVHMGQQDWSFGDRDDGMRPGEESKP